MGYTRPFHYACAVAASLGLTACSEDPQQRWSRAEIEQIVEDTHPYATDNPANLDDIEALRGDVDLLRSELEDLRATVNGNAEASNANRDTFNDNMIIIERRISGLESRLGH